MGALQFHTRALVTLVLVSLTTAASNDYSPKCGPKNFSLRDPPTFPDGTTPPGWTPLPTGWIYKPWYQVLTSNTQAAQLRNFQWDPTPASRSNPAGPLNDLSSFQIPGNSTVYTSYGVATPNASYVAVYDFRGTGILGNATSQYSWLGWGCDLNRNAWYVSYATAAEASGTPAGIDFMSVVDTGIDEKTLAAAVAALKRSSSVEVRRIAQTFVPNIQDGERRVLGRVRECDDKCKSNTELIGVIV
ncbi:hypothetical protein BU23DRAFT_572716 [Bimuria novae-zelandiae CBS 107.79]|uniref:Uncharacterized protein n=1 Tax=Bimuria novae-zelandiae CBS 107.79 TaxID=1447943 RepID=A0A6A5UTK2_9PLEO|nr:hypothetical protein BU23DRAFT_572716 [Bimuria novae-zelandiae CBS 107.79]